MDIESHGFKESDLDKEIYLNDINIPLHDIAVLYIYYSISYKNNKFGL